MRGTTAPRTTIPSALATLVRSFSKPWSKAAKAWPSMRCTSFTLARAGAAPITLKASVATARALKIFALGGISTGYKQLANRLMARYPKGFPLASQCRGRTARGCRAGIWSSLYRAQENQRPKKTSIPSWQSQVRCALATTALETSDGYLMRHACAWGICGRNPR